MINNEFAFYLSKLRYTNCNYISEYNRVPGLLSILNFLMKVFYVVYTEPYVCNFMSVISGGQSNLICIFNLVYTVYIKEF